MNNKHAKLQERYKELARKRSGYLDRARTYAGFTVKSLLSESDEHPNERSSPHGWQGIGAQALNHLSNKLAVTLFPPQRNFFQLDLTAEAAEQFEGESITEEDLKKALSKAENKSKNDQIQRKLRNAINLAMKHLPCTGNALMYVADDKTSPVQCIPLTNYVVRRALTGEVQETIVATTKQLRDFTEEEQNAIKSAAGKGKKKYKETDEVTIYTQCIWVGADNKWHIAQSADEWDNITKMQTKKKKDNPWIPLVWNLGYGEDYGRGLVEDHAGDFNVLEMLTEALAKGAVNMADIKYIQKPGAILDAAAFISADTGHVGVGDHEDLLAFQVDKFADLSLVANVIDEYKKRIGMAFMMNSLNRRDAERVTTYELRLDAGELETSLGGIYTSFSQSLQQPLAELFLRDLKIGEKKWKQHIEPKILTGLDALGRIGDLDKIAQFSEMMQVPTQWPDAMQGRIDWNDYAKSISTALNLEVTWLLDEDTVTENQEAEQAAAHQDLAVAEGAKAIPNMMQQQ
jgi:hypothetical protein